MHHPLRRAALAVASALCAAALSFAPAVIAAPEVSIHPETLEGKVTFDTSGLMGSPAGSAPVELQRAYPALDFERPIVFTTAGDGSGRVFVATQRGEVFVFDGTEEGVGEKAMFLDIRERVKAPGSGGQNEEGLMGLAFHPRYAETGELFIYYTREPMHSVVARFRVSKDDPNRADPDSEERLLELEQPYWNHNAGTIAFGPDGKLYVPFGDGGAGNDPHANGQDLSNLFSTLIRIDVDTKTGDKPYGVPPDNPFVDREGALPEIWAYGFRNPWGMSFDSKTGELWLADVGQNIWEEVDVVQRGGNYGWKVREGFHPFAPDAEQGPDPVIDPVWEYHHDVGKSITGGLVYRGDAIPELQGSYVCVDYVSFRMFALAWSGEKVTSVRELGSSRVPISAFGVDPAGEMILCGFDGKLYRLSPADAAVAERPEFPRKLSETGLFASTVDLAPAPGLVPYSVNVPLWSDGAPKERYVALPPGEKVGFRETEAWEFPVGTVFVKTFFLGESSRRRLETRLLIRNPFEGWVGYTYRWNDAQDDAELLVAAERDVYSVETEDGGTEEVEWYFPGPQDCLMCHTPVAGHVLGAETRQLNRHQDYGDARHNQLDFLASHGLLTGKPAVDAESLPAFPEWGSSAADIDRLARAYLDANCAMCHAPGGAANSVIDLRYETSLARSRLLEEVPPPRRGAPGKPAAVIPGDPSASALIQRLTADGPLRMPNIATNVVHRDAVGLLRQWIEGLPE